MNKLDKENTAARCLQLGQIIKGYNLKTIHPYKRLPNVKEFTITQLQPYDPILKDHGIHRRLGEAQMEWKRYKNKSMNRYVAYQFDRLNNSVSNPKRFWTIALQLLNQSYAYRVICFNHVYPNWHRKYKWSVVKNLLLSVSKLRVGRYTYRTVLIPKDEGNFRPLGVPAPS